MKSATLLEAPDAGGPTPDSPAPQPELLAHDWADDGQCTNPELVKVDFGPKAGKRAAALFLGLREDGTWRVGWHLVTKDGTGHAMPCAAGQDSFPARLAALRVGLGKAQQIFEGDRTGVQALAASFGRTLEGAADGESLPANGGAPEATMSMPLPEATPREIAVAAIQRNPAQPRKDFPAIQEQELADSIASVGLLQRIVVRQLLPEELGELPGMEGQERYEVVAGERRWRAFRRLGRETIRAEVYTGLTRAQAAAAALVENLQREGLNPIEEAEGYRDLMAKEGLTQEQCARRVGVSRPVVANALRVLDLPEKAVGLIREGKLTLAHGTALARFKKWPAVVAIIAEQAALEGLSAGELEQGLPCARALEEAGVVARISRQHFNWEVPPALKKEPSFFSTGAYDEFLLDAAAYQKFKATYDTLRQAEQEAEAEQERKKAERAARHPQKIKDLADLPQNSYVQIERAAQPLLALVPESARLEVNDGEEKALVCLKPDLFRRIEKAVEELKSADRKAKWTRILLDALAVVTRTKKLGPRETMLLLFLASRTGGGDLYPAPRLALEKGSGLGIEIPPGAMSEHYEGRVEFSPAVLTLLAKDPGPVDCYRVLIDSWLRQLENDLIEAEYRFAADSDLGALCRWLLERDELGFLEETKAGQKELLETVQAQEWYQRDLAEVEGREYVAPSAAAPAKPAKKGGRK